MKIEERTLYSFFGNNDLHFFGIGLASYQTSS